MLRRLDKELEAILIEADMYKDGWLAVSTIAKNGLVEVDFINGCEPYLHYNHLWTENDIHFCDKKGWKFKLTMWSNEPLTTKFKWNFVKNYQSRISALIRDLSDGMGVFRDETWDEALEILQEQELAHYESMLEQERSDNECRFNQ